MVHLLIFLSLLCSPFSGAAYNPQGPALLIDGVAFISKTTTKILRCNVDNTSGACSPRAPNTTAGYQGGSGGFRVRAIRGLVIAGTTVQFYLGYQDTDSGMSGSVGTNPIYSGTASTTQDLVIQAATTGWVGAAADFVVPSGKYLFVKQTGGSAVVVQVIGEEQ